MLTRVEVETGVIEGLPAADPRVISFKGIPFAAPPVGKTAGERRSPRKSGMGCFTRISSVP
jgi:para-nitrobenzyl esterase